MKRKAALLIVLILIYILMLPACSGGGETSEETGNEYSIVDYPHGSIIVVKDNKTGLFGGIDASGKLAVPCEYALLEYVGSGSHGDRYIVEKDGKYGFVDKTGNEVIPCEYDYVYSPATLDTASGFDLTDDLAVVEKSGKYGY